MKIDFGELDRARHERGHTIEDACAEMGISRHTWDAWKVRTVAEGAATVHVLQGRAAQEYIRRGTHA